MSYSCPRCGSENVQKLSLLHGSGTTGISATTLSTGMGRGHGGIGIAATHGEAQSLLAKRFAPPKPESAAGPIGCLAVLGFVIAVVAAAALDSVIVFWGIIGLTAALGAALARQAASRNAEQLPKAKALWQRRFVCLRCEEVFELQTEPSPAPGMAAGVAPDVGSPGSASASTALARSESYSVRLLSAEGRPIAAIKLVQDLLGLRILEAKQLVETAPNVVRTGLTLAEAEAVKAQFEAIGANADIVSDPAPFQPLSASQVDREGTPPTSPLPITRSCQDCGRAIARLDGSCSHCQNDPTENRPVPGWLWAGVVLLLIAGGVTYLSTGKDDQPRPQTQGGALSHMVVEAPQAAPPRPTLNVEVAILSGMLGPLEISGTTNLPEGTVLPIWVEGDYPVCTPRCGFEMEQAIVRNGHFQATVKGQDPAPGRYTVHVTTTTASAEPPNVEAILGVSGQNLRGPYVAALSDGGKYVPVNPDRDDASRYLTGFLVHYAQRIEIGEGGEVTVCPKRNTADDCGIPVPTPSSASASGPSDELPVTQPADTGR